MHPLIQFVIFYGLVNALFALVCASRYRLYIERRNAFEAAPENHWVRWQIPKDRKDLTFMQAFLRCYELLWVCTIILQVSLVAVAILKSNTQ